MNGSPDVSEYSEYSEDSERLGYRSFDSADEIRSEEYRIDVGGSDSDQSSVYYGAIHRSSDVSFDGDVIGEQFRSRQHCDELLHYCGNFILIIRCAVCCCPATLFSVFCGCCIEGLCTVRDTVSYCCQPFTSPPYYISRSITPFIDNAYAQQTAK